MRLRVRLHQERSRPFSIGAAALNVLIWVGLLAEYGYVLVSSGTLLLAVIGELYLVCLVAGLAVWSLLPGHKPLLFLFFSLLYLGLLLLFNGPFDIPLALIDFTACLANLIAAVEHWSSPHIALSRKNHLCRSGLMLLVILLGWASMSSFWLTLTIQAPDQARTKSSFWGSPDLAMASCTTTTTPIDRQTLLLTPDMLKDPPADYEIGALAYVEDVAVYSCSAEATPDGSVTLSTPLPEGTAEVTVTFSYVQNWRVLKALSETHACLILNGYDMRKDAKSRCLFQLLDYWRIPYYLQVAVNDEYSHVFNFESIRPQAIETLEWASQARALQQFQGISFDCEQEDYPQSPQNKPGFRPLWPGRLIPETWKVVKRGWYWMNEQDPALFKKASEVYDAVFARAEALGKKVVVVLGPSDFSEYIDQDQDYHANPALPLSSRENVLYGQMSYQDNRPKGRFSCYRDCVEQIRVLGDRGRSVLLGWISKGSSYYTDDETGFQRYVEDCRIAQAAGMTEIFHAPIYGVQHKWGDEAILRLHQALNLEPKPKIKIRVRQLTNFFFWDLYENINRVGWLLLGLEALSIAWLVIQRRRNPSCFSQHPAE